MVYAKKYKYQKAIYKYGSRAIGAAYAGALTGAAVARSSKKKLSNGRFKSVAKKVMQSRSLHQRSKAEVGGHGGTYSNFYYTPRKLPRAYSDIRALAKNYYVVNGSVRYTSTPGVQNANTLISMFNYADLNTISQKVSTNQTNKVLYKSCSSELLITNQDAGNCNILIYDIIARRDLATSANITTPDVAWARSYGDEGASNINWDVPGTTPFSADLFTQFYKVVKITHATLGQGQGHTHRIKFTPNQIVDGELIQYNTNGLKGLSCYTMVVQYGMPYNDTVTKTQVSIGQTALDFVWKKQYSYTWKQDVDTTYSVTNNLVSAFTVNEDIMNEATGAATVDTSA